MGVASEAHGPALLVSPSDADASVLWNKLEDTQVYGGQMPLTGELLNQPQRDLVKDWINDGATCGDGADSGDDSGEGGGS